MKRIFLFLSLILSIALCIEARTYVLVTGVSNYGGDGMNLEQSTKDAKRFKAVISSQTKDITLLTSKNVTRANLLEKLGAICNRAQSGDCIIFYYAGHGMPGAICGYDYAISYDDIKSLLEKSEASAKICFIDACHAGTMSENYSKGSWMKSADVGQAFFVGCRADENSLESPYVGAGFFTQGLLKGLRGKSDSNGDRQITVIELFRYIYKDVVKRSKGQQHPQLIAPKSMYDTIVARW